ncbi:hypothetical protein ANTPLA_LOCUS8922 [Anthophora plagiata]
MQGLHHLYDLFLSVSIELVWLWPLNYKTGDQEAEPSDTKIKPPYRSKKPLKDADLQRSAEKMFASDDEECDPFADSSESWSGVDSPEEDEGNSDWLEVDI